MLFIMGDIMNLTKLPKKVVTLLHDQGVDESQIKCLLYVELDRDCLFRDQILILTQNEMLLCRGEVSEEDVHYYKGYGTRENDCINSKQNWTFSRYSYKNVVQIYMEQQVACNTLLITIDGADTCIGIFTNSHKGEVREFLRCFETLKKGEFYQDVTSEDENLYCEKCGRMYPDSLRKVCPKCMNRKSVFVRVLHYFKPYRISILFILIGIILISLSNLIWPYLNGTILYDRILAKDQGFLTRIGIQKDSYLTGLLVLVITMVVTKLFFLLVQILQGVLSAKVIAAVIKDMKKDIFSNMGKLSIRFYRDRKTGSLMTRVMSDADRVTEFFFDGLPYIIIYGLMIIASLTVMFSINWQMTIATIVLMPICAICSFKMKPRTWVKYGKRHRAERTLNSTINDNLTGSRVVKSFGQEESESERFGRQNAKLKQAELNIVKQQNAFRILYGGAQEIANIAVWIIGVTLMFRGDNINMGVLITFAGYVGQMSGPMNFFANIFNLWADSMNCAQRMFEIMDAVPEITEVEQPKPLKNPKGDISLKNVSFGYDQNRMVLKNISFQVKAGETLGIVGYSGAGKSTLVQLISRLYDVTEGEILIDGINVKELSFEDLRKSIAMVSQDTYIFMGTVAENIAYADPDADRLLIVQAAKLAGAHEFIMRMPDGYDTRIGSSGRTLSGGERQRLSIARAILSNPKILILDEATASVDTETELAIQKSLQYLAQNRTTLSIAHRLSTLRDADELIVLEDGHITEQGNRATLYDKKGTYYKLLQLQTKSMDMQDENHGGEFE